MRRRFSLLFLLGVFLLISSCGPPPAPPAQQFLTDAKANLAAMDYDAALKNLDKLIAAAEGQPAGQQGVILRTALLTAIADGSKTMGDAFAEGWRMSRADSAQFVQLKGDYYGICRVRLMNAMEAVMAQRNKLGDAMTLEIAFPDYSGTEPVALAMVKQGQYPQDAERFRTEREIERNALARTLARIAGAGEDVAKGKTAFEKGSVQVDPRVYLLELSATFYKLSDIFDRKALDDPRYRRISLEVVRDNMDIVLKMLESKPDKDLETRAKKLKADCEKEMKKLAT
jgi:hypothetical protein